MHRLYAKPQKLIGGASRRRLVFGVLREAEAS